MLSLQPVTRENYNECLALERAQFDFVGDAATVFANAYIYRICRFTRTIKPQSIFTKRTDFLLKEPLLGMRFSL